MKKYLFLIVLGCMGMIRPMLADDTDISTLDNVIYVEPFSAKPGSTELTLSFQMKNSAPIRGFQFNLTLPEGVTAVTYANGNAQCSLSSDRLPEGDQHTLSAAEQTDGSYLFLCGSLQDEVFTGSSGEVATMRVNIDAGMAEGAYPIILTAMKLSETDISKSYVTQRIEATLTISNDVREVLDETSTTAPKASNGAVDVLVKRTIKADEWSTICLPFAMTAAQVTAAFGDDVQLADFKGYDITEEGGKIVDITVNFDNVTAIEANHPYIIKVSNAIEAFTVDGVSIAPDDVPCVSFGYETGRRPVVYHPVDFIGTYVADFDFYNDAQRRALFLSGNKFYYATEKTKHMKAFRAYFDFDDILDEVEDAGARVSMSFDEATGIRDNNRESITNNHYYDLQGRSAGTPVKKGLYINSGKKVIVK